MSCELAWEEYKLLYTTYEGFNAQSLTLKSWSVTVGLAGIIAAYSGKAGRNGRIAVGLAALSAIPFWVTDALWKSYQRANIGRLETLEPLEGCEGGGVPAPFIMKSWDTHYHWSDFLFLLHLPSVALPHVFTLCVGLLLAYRWPPGAPGKASP